MLKSHLRKRHPEYWHEVSHLLENSNHEIINLLKPNNWSFEAIEKIKLALQKLKK